MNTGTISSAIGRDDEAPRLFVSYSWTSEDHERWVLDLATQLRESGIDVTLDKWDLKEGHDAHRFMEQMVSDPKVRKVIIVADKKYVEKADGRHGGVGTETQIITPEIYAKEKQDKFVVVVAEHDEEGKPCLPVFYRSRIYIDLSDPELYAKNYEQLLRWAFDKPLHVKPALGQRPFFLSESTKPSLGTTSLSNRALDAIRNNRTHRPGAVSEYFDRLAFAFEELRIDPNPSGREFDDTVVESIESFLPYRNEAIALFVAMSQFEPLPSEQRAVHRFFERVYPLTRRTPDTRVYRDWDFDNYSFIVHELFLYLVAVLLKFERFATAAEFLSEPYYVGRQDGDHSGMVSFASFRHHLRSLDYRNKRLSLRRLSLRADMLKARAVTSGLPFTLVKQADFTLFMRVAVEAFRGEKWRQIWWPETLVYADGDDGPFEIYARARSGVYFEKVKLLLDINKKDELAPLMQAFMTGQMSVPHWDFDSFNPSVLIGYEALATK